MKSNIRLPWFWVVTVFMTAYFAQPHLLRPAPSSPAPSYSQSITNQTDTPAKPKIFALIVALIGIAVVGYIIWQIVKMANKIPPPDPPPGAPTNSPPVVINPTGSPGPAGSTSAAMVTTTHPNLDTNRPAWGTMNCYDITSLNYRDTWAKVPSLFSAFWSTGMTLSTNLVNWEDSHYRIDAFISDTGTFYAYFHYGTNYYNCYFAESAKAAAYFDMTDQPYRPAQFFRLDPK